MKRSRLTLYAPLIGVVCLGLALLGALLSARTAAEGLATVPLASPSAIEAQMCPCGNDPSLLSK